MDKTRKYVLICDIDNCYSDSREWVKFVPTITDTNKGLSRHLWDKYQEMSYLAKPNIPFIEYVLSICDLVPIYFVTSREDRHSSREDTINQIEKFSNGRIVVGDTHKLFMRKEFDYRPAPEVKRDITLALLNDGCLPIAAIDDDPVNCEMFLSLGILTKQYDIETNTFVNFKPTEQTSNV